MKAANRLFWAKTKDKDFFAGCHGHHDHLKAPDYIPANVMKEVDTHRDIHIKTCDSFRLCLVNYFKVIYCACFDRCFKRRKKLQKLFHGVEDKITSETNIVQIMKNLRNINIILENSLMS